MSKGSYKFGPMHFKTYFKSVGHGYEVGVTHSGKTVFVGNFVHMHEAKQWFKVMQGHLNTFCKSHDFVPTASESWYCKFLGAYLYKPYYAWLDKAFAKHTKTYTKEYFKGVKQYKGFEKAYWAKVG